MTRRTVIEVVAVAAVAAAIAVGLLVLRPAPTVKVGNRTWTVSWAVPAENAQAGGDQVIGAFPDGRAHDQSLRQILDLSLGGAAFRVRFTNEFGDGPLRLARATVAPAGADGAVDKHRMHQLKFGGSSGTTVAAGTEATSDPVPMAVTSGQTLAVTIAVVGTSPSPTVHQFAGRTSGISVPGTGDVASRADGAAYTIHTTADFWLATVEVLNPPKSVRAIATIGDSLTDAYFLADGDSTWPQLLRHRLETSPDTVALGVVDSGLAGNTVIDVQCGNCGTPMDQRVIRDAVNLPGVDTALVLGGTNDITRGATTAAIVHGLASVAAILHAHNMRAVAMTIPPRAPGSFGWQPATMERTRRDVNGWLRAQHSFDGLIDADRVLADPAHPLSMAPGYDVGDGTHLGPRGRAALAAAVPFELLSR